MLQLIHMRCPHLLPVDPMISHHLIHALDSGKLLRKGVLAAAEVAHALCDVQGHSPHALLGAHAVVRPSVPKSHACRLVLSGGHGLACRLRCVPGQLHYQAGQGKAMHRRLLTKGTPSMGLRMHASCS